MSKIEWTDVTWNPVTGCTKVSQGCKNCYAERLWPKVTGAAKEPTRRFTDVRCHPERLDAPLHWKKPRMVFVNSMSDLFHEDVPDEFISKILGIITVANQHIFQVLTKRPERMLRYFSDKDVRKNLWLGVSAEDQITANERIPVLLKTPAAARFVSYEPALGPVDFSPWLWHTVSIDWIIAGGESGPRARESNVDWFKSVRDQCFVSQTAFFMKQITERGKRIPFELSPKELQVREYPL